MNSFEYMSTYMGNITCRGSHQSCSVEKSVLKNLANFTRKHMFWSFFLINFAKNFVKKRLQHRRCPAKFAKFLRTSILKNIC